MRDLKHLIFMEDLLQEANNDLVKQAKAEGRRALGYTCNFMPEVLLDLAGCFSVRLRAPRSGSPDMATYYMSARTCHFGRSLMERALEGGFNFLDAQMATETCTVTCRFQEHLMQKHLDSVKDMDIIQNPDFFCEFTDVPFKKTENSYLHYRQQLQAHVLDPLAQNFGIDTSDEALLKARQVLALLPSSNLEDAEIVDADDLNRLLPAIDPADADALLNAVADQGTLLELYAAYEPSVKVALARLGGYSVGLVAANGKLTAGALQKAARFVRFMDCYGIPVVSLLNTCGVEVNGVKEQGWLFKAQSQLLYAYAEATVPKVAVVTGDAIGQAYVAMGGKAMADVTYAWPSAVISALTPEAAVAVLYQDEVKADKELSVEEVRAKYASEYVENVAGCLNAAKQGMVDDVIEPAQTRAMLISALEMLMSKRDSNPPKKHGNLPM